MRIYVQAATTVQSVQDRLLAAVLALVLLGGVLALLLYSLGATHHVQAEREIFLTSPSLSLRPSAAVTVIDARGAAPRNSRRSATSAPQILPAQSPSATAPSLPPQSAHAIEPPVSLGKFAAPGLAPSRPAAKNDLLTSPYQSQNQEHWDAEMQRKKDGVSRLLNPNPPNSNAIEIEPGADGQVGVSVVVHDPLCQLVVLLAGTGSCGPPKATHISTDAQFKAALDAVNKRHGVDAAK